MYWSAFHHCNQSEYKPNDNDCLGLFIFHHRCFCCSVPGENKTALLRSKLEKGERCVIVKSTKAADWVKTENVSGVLDKAPVEPHLYLGDEGKRYLLGLDGQNSAKTTIPEQMSQPRESNKEERAGLNDPL